jgi:RND family efflux transporter MFP subunit
MKTEILFLAGMCLCACSRTPQEQTSFPSVKVVHAEVMEAPSSRCYTFISQPYRLSELSFRVGGPVHAFDVQQGQFFRKGQLIAAIDERDFVIQKQRTEALYRQAEVDYARISSLYAKDNISGMNYEQAKANYERTKADYEAAVNAWEDSRLYAPFDGVIAEKEGEVGQNVIPGAKVARLVSAVGQQVRIAVPENEIAHVAIGQQAVIFVSALSKEYRGKVAEKGVVANALSRSYEVKLKVEDADGELLPGMITEVTLLNPQQEAYVLPAQVVQLDHENQTFVWMVRNHCVEKQVIECKEFTADGVIVSSGLKRGDFVIIEGQQKVCQGIEVREVGL